MTLLPVLVQGPRSPGRRVLEPRGEPRRHLGRLAPPPPPFRRGEPSRNGDRLPLRPRAPGRGGVAGPRLPEPPPGSDLPEGRLPPAVRLHPRPRRARTVRLADPAAIPQPLRSGPPHRGRRGPRGARPLPGVGGVNAGRHVALAGREPRTASRRGPVERSKGQRVETTAGTETVAAMPRPLRPSPFRPFDPSAGAELPEWRTAQSHSPSLATTVMRAERAVRGRRASGTWTGSYTKAPSPPAKTSDSVAVARRIAERAAWVSARALSITKSWIVPWNRTAVVGTPAARSLLA